MDIGLNIIEIVKQTNKDYFRKKETQHTCIYFLNKYSGLNYREISDIFNIDRTEFYHSIKKVNKLAEFNLNFRYNLKLIEIWLKT